MRASVSSFGEDFEIYGTEGRFTGWQASASVGDRARQLVVVAQLQPARQRRAPDLVREQAREHRRRRRRRARPSRARSPDRNPRNQDWLILGSTTSTHTIQDHAKLKVAYDFSPSLRASYTLGWWSNDAERSSESYLRDAGRQPGVQRARSTSTAAATRWRPTDFAPTVGDLRAPDARPLDQEQPRRRVELGGRGERLRLRPRPRALAARRAAGRGRGRSGAHRGSGAARAGTRSRCARRGGRSEGGNHVVDLGYQRDDYELRTLRVERRRLARGGPTTPFSAFRGDTRARERLRAGHLGVRGRVARDARRARRALERVERRGDERHDDAAVRRARGDVRLAEGRDRAPAHARLDVQGVARARGAAADRLRALPGLDRDQRHRQQRSEPEAREVVDVASSRPSARSTSGSLRATLFHEDTDDALYSQTNVLVTPNVTNIQNVDQIRTSGLEVAFQSGALLGGRLDLATSLTYAHSRIEKNDKFPASVGKWQPRVPRLARQRARDLSPRLAVVGRARLALQRHAIQHARQLGPERLHVHGQQRVHRVRSCARVTRARGGRPRSASTTSATRSIGRSTRTRGACCSPSSA